MINKRQIIPMITVFIMYLPVLSLAGTVDLPQTGQTGSFYTGMMVTFRQVLSGLIQGSRLPIVIRWNRVRIKIQTVTTMPLMMW